MTQRIENRNEIHYNVPDPDCTGPFGLCTQEDKDRLGYFAIKILHEKMDDDRDGHIEIKETKEFLSEELQYKNGENDREKKFHRSDSMISVDEMWKSWHHSQVFNWTIDEVVAWVNDQVKLPQYSEYFRRNRIDGQFFPRLAINENHYYSNVMQIKDPRHKRLLIIKATDLVLFGPTQKPHNFVKDFFLVGSLTLSIIFSLYLYGKHRQSLDRIRRMMSEVEKLGTTEENETLINQLKNNLKNDDTFSNFNMSKNDSCASLFSIRKRSIFSKSNSVGASFDPSEFEENFNLKENQTIIEKNQRLAEELNQAKTEADYLREARENTNGQLKRLELAEQELEKVRAALKQTEARLEIVKFQTPQNLTHLLNRTYESERQLLEYKFITLQKEKEACFEALNKISKRQSGLLGALKIAHSSTLEEINHKLEILKHEIQKCKSDKHEWNKRWSAIDEICVRNNETNFSENFNQDQS
ncbi:stromal interaction molecule [Brachionus plicatilis]|uniref:Stromal interaction molecule n=1 Tax=Brachionus plicatilis TaxID=10195 RepID=A0A3M7SGP3_BRAPC|nr:stromal interaction molecule [Brachionus plicatilis]